MKLNQLFWGIFLIVLGGLILLNNYFNFSFEFDFLFNFWPLILILIGLKIIIKNKAAASLIVIVAAIVTATIVYSFIFENITCRHFRYNKDIGSEKRETISNNFNSKIKKSYLEIDYNLGDFNLSSDTEKLIEGEVLYRKGKYFFDGEIDDSIASYRLVAEDDSPIKTFTKKKYNKLNLSIHPIPEWKLKINTNFVENNYNLHKINLGSLDLESNFSKGFMKINPSNTNSKIYLDVNFSKMKIEFTDSIGVEVFVNENLSSIDLSGFDKIEEDHYKSKNFEGKKSFVQLNITSNFSKIEIIQ